jgi:hypothetical protein
MPRNVKRFCVMVCNLADRQDRIADRCETAWEARLVARRMNEEAMRNRRSGEPQPPLYFVSGKEEIEPGVFDRQERAEVWNTLPVSETNGR